MNINRRQFLKKVGGGVAVTTAIVAGCNPEKISSTIEQVSNLDDNQPKTMTYRTDIHGDSVSILGFGCMRLPTVSQTSARDSGDEIDQEAVNRQVDIALERGINYFDTAPTYCKGKSEEVMGIALSRHPREKYLIATKLSNAHESMWSREASLEMYRRSLQRLRTNYIDYMLLHNIGRSKEIYEERFVKNGILQFLMDERKAGRIRNLGFSFHGSEEVFDYLLSLHDEVHWDFVQIQMNYVDWKHAKQISQRNANAEYLYNALDRLGIPVVIMEPLLGGRLATLNQHAVTQLKQREPEKSIASWAFRFAGSFPRVLTVLSGMTYMEHLYDNLDTYSPLKPLNEAELELLEQIAANYAKFPLVPCTQCQYCMPCPYGIDIPTIFAHYNKCLNEGNVAENPQSENYRRLRKIFLIGYDRSVPKLRQANHCIGCNQCVSFCPQHIKIPEQLHRIDRYVEELKVNNS